METLLFRADAGPDIGAGHVMRCLALALAWQTSGGRAVFLTRKSTLSIARYRDAEIESIELSANPGSKADAEVTVHSAAELGANWIVVDGYHFDGTFQKLLATSDRQILWIDDEAHAPPYSADLVLNQNPHANKGLYRDRAQATGLLLGSRYALLRPEFLRASVDRSPDRVTRILITLGGSDPLGLTGLLISALLPALEPDAEIRAIVGPLAKEDSHLTQLARQNPSVHLLRSVQDMAKQMEWAHLAVAAAGSTCWELAALGLPALLVAVAKNQRPLATSMARSGAAIDLGPPEGLASSQVETAFRQLAKSPSRYRAASQAGPALVDGQGADRVLNRLREATREPRS